MDEHQVQSGQQWLEELLRLSGLPIQVQTDLSKFDTEGSCWLTIDPAHSLTPDQIQSLIGKDGIGLDAMQYLANTTLNMGRAEGTQVAFTIELDGYRVRRQAQLQELADQAAEQVRETGQEYEMAALSAAERRQVHTYLKSFDDLDTYSRGREPDRRLVVKLANSDSENPQDDPE
ncbi:MAG: RNA-binding protein [Oculatellaceae cyanobacterium Prado106]|jgi:spoIIIJ-associated protein|nr:RNA-binding protein [Oculatellaceae cyanobacterium Prado106]